MAPLFVINFFAGTVFPRLLFQENNSPVVGSLSATETLGGCIGAIFAGCFAMQNYGLMATFVGGGMFALATGGLGRKGIPEQAVCSVDPQIEKAPIALGILAAVCVSGVASLGMEVVWQRLLILIVGTDAFSYAIVVTSYLLGIAVGAAVSGIWLRLRPSTPPQARLQTVAMLQVLVAITSLIVLVAVIYLASVPGQAWISRSLFGHDTPLLNRLLLCVGLLLSLIHI